LTKNILYEASDLERGIGLILFEDDGERFQLHIWNEDDHSSAIIMDLDKRDIVRLSASLDDFT